MYKISKILLLFLLFSSKLIDECNCARILFTGAVDSGTHIGSMVPLIKRLASSGNQITVLELATLDQPRSLGPNVSVHFIPVPVDKGIATKLAAEMFRVALNGRSLQLQYQLGNDKFAEFMQTHTNVFVNLLNQKFDLIILDEIFGVHSYAIALHFHRFHSVPYAIYSTTMMIQSTAFSLGLGRNFVAEPNLLTSPPANSNDFYLPTNLLNRLDNLRTILWDLFRVNWQTEWLLDGPKSSLKLLAIPHFSFQQLFGQASFFFVDYLDRVPAPLPGEMANGNQIVGSESYPNNRIHISKAIDLLPISANCPSIRPLPPELAKFVEDPSSAGTIFIAFGTNVHWRFAPPKMVRAFFLVLNRLRPYRIIFSFNGNIPEGIILEEHFKVVNWAPQFDILAHPKTKLFISHGGLKSFKETLCAKIPAVYMPIYAEQSYNTKIALRIGFGTAISKYSMNEDKLENAIQIILQNYEHFNGNAKRANAFFLDRPLDGMGMAEFGINRAIKEGVEGQKRRRKWRKRKAMGMGIFETANIDVGLAILALILALIG